MDDSLAEAETGRRDIQASYLRLHKPEVTIGLAPMGKILVIRQKIYYHR